jgi:hypothetical protein
LSFIPSYIGFRACFFYALRYYSIIMKFKLIAAVLLASFVGGMDAQSMEDSRALFGALAVGQVLGNVVVETGDSYTRFDEDKPPAVLLVESEPSDAEVSVNFSGAGSTPLGIRKITPGSYTVTITKDRYYTAGTRVEIAAGKTVKVMAKLKGLAGFLKIRTEPADCEIIVDGRPATGERIELPVGDHEVLVRKFGFEDQKKAVRILRDETAEHSFRLSEAPFDIRSLRQNRPAFNPSNPGILGRTEVSFETTTYGAGSISVLNKTGASVFVKTFDRFTQRENLFTWTGRTDASDPVPDGQYTILIKAGNGAGTIEKRLPVVVDSTLVIRYRALSEKASGLFYAPDTAVLPPASYQITSGFFGFLPTGSRDDPSPLFPLRFGLRAGIFKSFEASVATGLRISDSEASPSPEVDSVVKYAIVPIAASGFGFGVYAGGSVAYKEWNAETLGLSGGGLGFVLEYKMGPFRFAASPSMRYSLPSAAAYASGALGACVDSGGLTAGISAELTAETSKAFKILFPLRTAAEFHLPVGETPFFLSGYAAVLFYGETRIVPLLGGSLGLLY